MSWTLDRLLDALRREAPAPEKALGVDMARETELDRIGLLDAPRPEAVADCLRRGARLLVSAERLPADRLAAGDPAARSLQALLTARAGLLALEPWCQGTRFSPAAVLARLLSLSELEPGPAASTLEPSDRVKFVVFVPRGHEAALLEAVHEGGGGRIGAYSHCSFSSPGKGSYRPLEGSNPFAGEQGRLEQADELRMEFEVPRERMADVLERARRAHPYEEMAHDIFPMERPVARSAGLLLARAPRPRSLKSLRRRLGETLGPDTTRLLAAAPGERVSRLALAIGLPLPDAETLDRAQPELVLADDLRPSQAARLWHSPRGVLAIDRRALRHQTLEAFANHFIDKGADFRLVRPRRGL